MTAGTPGISVIIPFHDVEAWFDACLGSVIQQDYRNLEIIVVDDASTDGSRAIAERHAARDPRLRILTHPVNQGLGPARNTGARAARGEHIFFLDSDDLLTGPRALGQLADAVARGRGRIVIGASQHLMADGRIEHADQAAARGFATEMGGVVPALDAFLAAFGLSDRCYLPLRAWGMLVQRQFYEQAALAYPAGEHEDMAHAPFLYFLAGGVEYRTDIIVNYRIREDSLCRAPWSQDRIRRYGELWRAVRENIRRVGLTAYQGDVALCMVGHLFWRLEANDGGVASPDAVAAVVCEIFSDITEFAFPTSLGPTLDSVQGFLNRCAPRSATLADFTRTLPAHLRQDQEGQQVASPVPASGEDSRDHPTEPAQGPGRLSRWRDQVAGLLTPGRAPGRP